MFYLIKNWRLLIPILILGLVFTNQPTVNAAGCAVPAGFATIQSAIDDAGCSLIEITEGDWHENLTIQRDLSIIGTGTIKSVLNGDGSAPIIQILGSPTVFLSGLRIEGGSTGIVVPQGAQVTVENSDFIDNIGGGGYQNINGNSILRNVTFSGNQSDRGGAILAVQGTLFMDGFTLDGNSAEIGAGTGGGIQTYFAPLTLLNGTLQNNNASDSGGGISNLSSTISLQNVALSHNSAVNDGGGIWSDGALTVISSTLNDNSATKGGAIYQAPDNDFILHNSTLSANSATQGGSAIWSSRLTATYATIAYNSGSAALYKENVSGAYQLSHSIIAYSPNSNCGGEIAAISGSTNLDDDGLCGLEGSISAEPYLQPLQNNGGSTFTHALPQNSPAIEQGTACPTTDQRGIDRSDLGGVCDLGAYETAQSTAVTLSTQNATAPTANPFIRIWLSGLLILTIFTFFNVNPRQISSFRKMAGSLSNRL